MAAFSSMKLGACPPFLVCGWRWHVWKPFPGLHCFPSAITVPPLMGDLISQHHGFVIAADSQEDDFYVHEGP